MLNSGSMRGMKHAARILHLLTATLLVLTAAALGATSASAAAAEITDGNARFQVITPTLLRLEQMERAGNRLLALLTDT